MVWGFLRTVGASKPPIIRHRITDAGGRPHKSSKNSRQTRSTDLALASLSMRTILYLLRFRSSWLSSSCASRRFRMSNSVGLATRTRAMARTHACLLRAVVLTRSTWCCGCASLSRRSLAYPCPAWTSVQIGSAILVRLTVEPTCHPSQERTPFAAIKTTTTMISPSRIQIQMLMVVLCLITNGSMRSKEAGRVASAWSEAEGHVAREDPAPGILLRTGGTPVPPSFQLSAFRLSAFTLCPPP